MNTTRKTELLSPAKNLECGIAAINHGADAVYIGASKFGARAAAGNSVDDIETLAKYAHQYRSKVFVALNTILTDEQLPEAERLIQQVHNAGADALIVQDMGVLNLNLPPIPLHASTQTDNRTVEKVRFLQQSGFSRVVLARELTLKQIGEISNQTNAELEAFVHGALCVSYSGQCYISQAMTGRSANRGQCAQYCRLPYYLEDANGQTLIKNKHLLSLKDLDLSDYLEDMMEAGVMSFKIEGRLKDINYVKNITAYYRKKLDNILEGNNKFSKASLGQTHFFFEPNPEKSFRRGATDYFLNERKQAIIQPDTPKSLGEPIGKVIANGRNFFDLSSDIAINNGDGLCFCNSKGELNGFRINRAEIINLKNQQFIRCFPASLPPPNAGTFLFRNQDQEFDKLINGKTSERKIDIRILFTETDEGFRIQLTDEENIQFDKEFAIAKQAAMKPGFAEQNIHQQLSKLGNTIYQASSVTIRISGNWFIPASQINEWRRETLEAFDKYRAEKYIREQASERKKVSFPEKTLSYLGNVTNKMAQKFYIDRGVEDIQHGFEVKAAENVPLMFTKYCIKFEYGWCPKEGNNTKLTEPLYIRTNEHRFQLKFDCKKCEMHIFSAK